MQCPRCGEYTPGTPSGCARCGAPLDRRPDPQVPPGRQHGGAGQGVLDATMLDAFSPVPSSTPTGGVPLPAPPPAPWATQTPSPESLGGADFMGLPASQGGAFASPQSAEGPPPSSFAGSSDSSPLAASAATDGSSPPGPATPPFSAPSPADSSPSVLPAPPPFSPAASSGPSTPPPFSPAVSPQAAAPSAADPQFPASASSADSPAPAAPASRDDDPEATQAWTMPPEDEEEPKAPAAAAAERPPAPPARAESKPEPIVPDSWFAEPRSPSGESAAEQTRQLPPEPGAVPGAEWGAPAYPAAQPGGYGDQAWQMQQGLGMMPGGYPPNAGYPGPVDPYAADGGYPAPDGAYAPASPRSSGRSNKSLAIAVGVLVMVAVAAVVVVLRPDGGEQAVAGATASATPRNASQQKPPEKAPGPGPAARRQARAIDKLLTASAETRGQLGQALHAASKCRNLPVAIQGFQRVAQRRNNQIRRTNALKVDKLKNGEQLRAALLQSFQLSLQTDQAFLAWAQAAQGCKGRPRPDDNYARGNALSAQATVAKRRFTVLWNPIAQSTGLPTRTESQF